MILSKHPYGGIKFPQKAIGYWYSDTENHLPHPKDFIDTTWDVAEKELVISYLDTAPQVISCNGLSYCRLCEKDDNGSRCLADDEYIWPEGFSHYIREHSVRPPKEFIKHIKGQI